MMARRGFGDAFRIHFAKTPAGFPALGYPAPLRIGDSSSYVSGKAPVRP
jgi:hypothetical protein